MKPREFWLCETSKLPDKEIDYYDPEWCVWSEMDVPQYGPAPARFNIHVREVVPIDWEKIWKEMGNTALNMAWHHPMTKEKIQELVEKQLKGEE